MRQNENEDEKIWKNKFNFSIVHIKIRLSGHLHENPRKIVLTHFNDIFDSFLRLLTNRSTNEDEDEEIWKNESEFWILHVKISSCGNFHENPRKKFLTHFL